MKIIDKENNIVEDKCPSCGKDGAIMQTTEYADSGKYVEVMCLNGCGHFARIERKKGGDEDVGREKKTTDAMESNMS